MSATLEAQPAVTDSKELNAYPWWALRFWSGMRFGSYWRMLRRHRFDVDAHRWGMALILAQMTPWNSALYRLQRWRYSDKMRAVGIDKPPVFIIGHWRSGTTHLHELMVRDEQFDYPTTYECFAPHHFLVSEWVLSRLLSKLLPGKRPMDNMATGMQRPQEDEFGLAAMGAPTTYYRMGFPRHPADHMDTLNMRDISDADRRRFMQAINYFYKALTLKQHKRLLLKSPPHTGRVEFLSRMYPGAKFVHITRHPYAIFPSMRRCWMALDEAQGFHRRKDYGPDFDEFIHRCYEEMYRDFDDQVATLDPGCYCEVRYDELAQQPVSVVQSIYEQLRLAGFDEMRPALEEYVATLRDYRPNRLQLEPRVKEEIDRRWRWYLDKYAYERDPG